MTVHESMMEFRVEDMTCNHCIDAITAAVKGVDPDASVEVSLLGHIVRVESDMASEDISEAISDAGYTPVATPPGAY